MIREWLPHLLVGLVALTATSFGAWLLSSNDSEWEDKQHSLLGGFSHSVGNSTVEEAHLPPRAVVAWATAAFSAIGGFYVAASISGWIHRSRGG